MAELVDAQDLKSCGLIIRPGSIPGICTNDISVRTNRTDRKNTILEKNGIFLFLFLVCITLFPEFCTVGQNS